jgi:predicted Zn-ribbon and HTH transcriptional regulator
MMFTCSTCHKKTPSRYECLEFRHLCRVCQNLGRNFAHRLAQVAASVGAIARITKSTRCVDCGRKATGYEHRDYNKPLSVVPICSSCNIRRGCGKPITAHTLKRIKTFGLRLEKWGVRHNTVLLVMTKLSCNLCRHKWVPRHTKRPGVCPACKRHDWDKPKAKTGA